MMIKPLNESAIAYLNSAILVVTALLLVLLSFFGSGWLMEISGVVVVLSLIFVGVRYSKAHAEKRRGKQALYALFFVYLLVLPLVAVNGMVSGKVLIYNQTSEPATHVEFADSASTKLPDIRPHSFALFFVLPEKEGPLLVKYSRAGKDYEDVILGNFGPWGQKEIYTIREQ
jgi:hypothetical protein